MFVAVPKTSANKKEIPNQRRGMIALHNIRIKVAQNVSTMRLGTALCQKLPSRTDSDLKFGTLTLLYRDKGTP